MPALRKMLPGAHFDAVWGALTKTDRDENEESRQSPLVTTTIASAVPARNKRTFKKVRCYDDESVYTYRYFKGRDKLFFLLTRS